MNIIDELDSEIVDLQKKLGRIMELKRLAKLLPIQLQQSEGSISTYSTYRLSLTLRGGDTKYAELFDMGFEFPAKPTFNEYNQQFSRRTTTEVLDETRMVPTESSEEDGLPPALVPTRVKVDIEVAGIEKPPSCRIVETKKREMVKRYKAVCEESGEEL